MNSKQRLLGLFILILCYTFQACVDDVDLDQAEEFEFSPVVNLDLVFFSVNQSNFLTSNEQLPVAVLNDTTQLDFLNDNFFRENIRQIDFVFQFENTFNTGFASRAIFIAPNNQERISFDLDVIPSTDGSTQISRLERTVVGEELMDVIRSASIVIQLTPEELPTPLAGELSFQSRAVYFLEFDDL